MQSDRTISPIRKIGYGLIIFSFILLFLLAYSYTIQRLNIETRQKAEIEITKYNGQISAELQRAELATSFLASDLQFRESLDPRFFKENSERLENFRQDFGLRYIFLLDARDQVIAQSTNIGATELGEMLPQYATNPPSIDDSFVQLSSKSSEYFIFSDAIMIDEKIAGRIVVFANLDNIFANFNVEDSGLLLVDDRSRVMLSSDPAFLGIELDAFFSEQDMRSVWDRITYQIRNWMFIENVDLRFKNQALFRYESTLSFRNWSVIYLSNFQTIRERANSILTYQLATFFLIAAIFIVYSALRARRKTEELRTEYSELQSLNVRLSREISERQRIESTLKVAEQSLAQSSRLAALGEMSAAVSHELNQPLAAMRTYLAGARLLLDRGRLTETLSSFQRIDDLIERMSVITHQLKSYARKEGGALVEIDMRKSVSEALAMMTPQLEKINIDIRTILPKEPVIILADSVRLEQVIVNLLKNAMEAIARQKKREIEIMLVKSDKATLSIRDNGDGIKDLDKLFSPFYTTKPPGEGVGLGLAICSDIVKKFGGRLFGRNSAQGGAVFELQLPLSEETQNIAEDQEE